MTMRLQLLGNLILSTYEELLSFEAWFYYFGEGYSGQVDISLIREFSRSYDLSFDFTYHPDRSLDNQMQDFFFEVVEGERRVDAIEIALNELSNRKTQIARLVDIHFSGLISRQIMHP